MEKKNVGDLTLTEEYADSDSIMIIKGSTAERMEIDKFRESIIPGNQGADGSYYTPVVTQPDADTMQVAYTPSKDGMSSVAPKSITLPVGPTGADGKTAYQYAQEGGYTGTEEEFAAKLAQELPTALPNPHALTINGQSYDGSAAVEVNISGSSGGTELVLSDNLFDKSTAILGKGFYHSSSGTQLIDAADNYYAYVELRGPGTYRTKVSEAHHGETYAQRVPLLDADKNWIQNITGTITDTGDDTAWDLEFTVTQDMIDAGAVYYPLTIHKNNINTLMMVKDRDYPSEYIPYGYIEVATDEGTAGLLANVLYEKTAVFLGDSICAGTTVGDTAPEYGWGWAGLIGEANGMAWKNYGRNGGTITPIESIVAQSRDLFSQADLAAADYPDADYVIFEGGTNDADQLTMTGIGVISDDFETFDTSTFSGAMESLILKLMTTFPNAQIGYIVAQKMGNPPYTSAGSTRRKFFDRAVEICQKWGIPVIDLWNGGLLNPALTYHAENFYTDGQHLTLAGFQRISPQIEAWMRNLTMPGAVSGGGNSAPEDWNAAEGEPGHILNRTHCKKVTTMLKNAVCAYDGDVYTLPECGSLVVGNTYDITIDGTTYSLKAFELDGVPAIGSVEYFETFDPTLPVPLGFMEETPGVIYGLYGDMTAENITVTLITYTYETIPVEYLPKQYHVIPVSSDAWVKTDGAYNITDYDIRDLYSAYKAGYPVYIDIDYGEYGTKRIQITGYCFNWHDLLIQQAFEQNHYTISVFLAGVWHNGLGAEIVTVRINVTD